LNERLTIPAETLGHTHHVMRAVASFLVGPLQTIRMGFEQEKSFRIEPDKCKKNFRFITA